VPVAGVTKSPVLTEHEHDAELSAASAAGAESAKEAVNGATTKLADATKAVRRRRKVLSSWD